MIKDQLWSLLGIIIALTAYVATVRRRVLDKTKEEPAKSNATIRNRLFNYTAFLMIADVPLVISGALIVTHNLLLLGGKTPWVCLGWGGIGLFCFALCVLAIFHGIEWRKSLLKIS